jgi:hypothetical protein
VALSLDGVQRWYCNSDAELSVSVMTGLLTPWY